MLIKISNAPYFVENEMYEILGNIEVLQREAIFYKGTKTCAWRKGGHTRKKCHFSKYSNLMC